MGREWNRLLCEFVRNYSPDPRKSSLIGILSTAYVPPCLKNRGLTRGPSGSSRSYLLECILTANTVDIAIIGAGPYGLSLAAHMRGRRQSVRIFGSPMHSWSHHMPQGMHLKSEGFASNLYDPEGKSTLEAYCAEQAIPYADIGLPVAIDTFIAYGREFQRRYAPELENLQITSLKNSPGF